MFAKTRKHDLSSCSSGVVDWKGRLIFAAAALLVTAGLWLAAADNEQLTSEGALDVTPVTAATDSIAAKAIEDIQVGDFVRAKNPVTGEMTYQRVTRLYRRRADHLRILHFRSADDQSQTIETTDEHPFWVVGHGWFKAGDLRPGDEIKQSDGDSSVLLSTDREFRPTGVPVYNIETEDFHTYFVAANGARAPPLLVHNCDVPISRTPYRDPQRPPYNNGKIHTDHRQARALGGPDTDANKWPLPAETNLRKGGHEGAIKRYEEYLQRNGMSKRDARRVTQAEIDSLGNSPPPRPMDPDVLDQLPDNPLDQR